MSTLEEIKSYSPANLHEGKEWYVAFYAYSPVDGKRKRKKIKLNHITKIAERRKYAKELIKRVNNQLSDGWNPWIECDNNKSYTLFNEVVHNYRSFIDKMYRDGNYREATYKTYVSNLNNFVKWNASQAVPLTYIYQLERKHCIAFLDHVYIFRDNSAFTRDKYLVFLQTFSSWLLAHDYVIKNPTAGLHNFSKRSKKKTRILLNNVDLKALTKYLEKNNPHYLLACYVLYYCFIRPKEMSFLKIKHISLKRQTIFVPGDISKNKKDGTITLPKKVIELMLKLNIFDAADDDYLFSQHFKPGDTFRDSKAFRDYWLRLRKLLKFPSTYKFYSLKDTGITNMLRHYDVLSVRDQARHSSILMTDIYTPHDIQQANSLIKNYQDDF